MAIHIELQNVINSEHLPSESLHQQWLQTALDLALENTNKIIMRDPELTIRVVSELESQALNRDYRQKDKATNVLSFPFEAPDMIPSDEMPEYLGDLVVCESILLMEATNQNKTYQDHYAHLVIHGLLHLLGFDHISDAEAEEMENLEVKILAANEISNPYYLT